MTTIDRGYLQYALKDLMDQMNCGTMPFLDSDLTEGVINLIVQQCHKICRQEHLDALVPGLNRSSQLDIMDIFNSIFLTMVKETEHVTITVCDFRRTISNRMLCFMGANILGGCVIFF